MIENDGNEAELSPEKRELLARLLEAEGGEFNTFPLSFAQQRLWLLDQLEPGTHAYNMPAVARLKGELDAAALEAALNEVARRHETLRTTFGVAGDEPVQVIAPALALPLSFRDLTPLGAGAAEAEAAALIAAEARRPFDLARGPLVRATLLRVGPRLHLFALVMHHIISDGWSMDVLVREVAALYEARVAGRPSPLPELPIQYADFAEWQREWLEGGVLESQLEYWKRQLAGDVPALELPADRPRPPAQTFRGASVAFSIEPELTQSLAGLGRRADATLFMTLLAAFQTLLHRYSRQHDVAVGVPVANRTRAEVEPLIGFFVNTLVMRTSLEGDPTFRELLARVREVSLEAFAHQDVPFEKLVEALRPERDVSRNPFFQVLFALQSPPPDELRLGDLVMSLEEFDSGATRFDLELHLWERGGGLSGTLIYNTDLFHEATARRMLAHFRTLLEGVAATPDSHVSELPLLSAAEELEALRDWNSTAVSFPHGGALHELFERQAAGTPEAAAVIYNGSELSYGELNRRANRLARRLRGAGVGPDAVVGLCLERSADLMVGLLGILKAGGAYLPLDPAYPRERLRLMLEDSRAAVLVTDGRLAPLFGETPAHVVRLDAERDELARESAENLGAGAGPDNLLYVIYTSGSTGRPKGVAMPHRPLVNLVQWQMARSGGAKPRTLQFTSLSFDVSCQEIFSTWCAGASLVLAGEDVRRDAGELLRSLAAERVERLFLPFVALHYLAEAADSAGEWPPALREVITAGEQLKTTPRLQSLFENLPGCTLDNQYGPTEAHVVSAHMLPASPTDWPPLPPIGRPVANAQLYVLDAAMRPAPVGVAGDLYIGGDCLARGYLHNPSATAEKFVPSPFAGRGGARLYRTGDLARRRADGEIEFLGRADHQVKIRGFRIEPGEIETALQRHERVREAVVLALPAAGRESRLVAYVLAERGEIQADELRAFLRESLPEHMTPALFVFLDEMPLTPSGKVDRRRLPAPARSDAAAEGQRPAGSAPRTPTEELLAVLWSDVLGVPEPGPADNFFESGGHSLLATQLVSRVREAFGVEAPLRRLFEEPTLGGLARVIDAERDAGEGRAAPPPLIAGPREGRTPLSFAQQRIWFMSYLEKGVAVYVLPAALRLRGALDAAALERSFNEVVRRHDILRTTFQMFDGEPAQVVSEFEPLGLPVLDLSARPADEREAEATRLAGEEAREPFDLERGPLLRVRLLRLSEDDHVLLLTMHHIIADGWSLEVLMREITQSYAAFASGRPSPLEPLPIQYADFTRWQREWLRGEVLEEQLDYWRGRLRGAAPVLELPSDKPRPAAPGWAGERRRTRLPAPLCERLRALARAERVTLFMLLLAGFKALLYRYTGQEDVSVGTPIAGRSRGETEPLIGLFINMLLIRSTPRGRQSFRGLLREVRRAALDAYKHQDLPFERLVDELHPERDLSRTPLFQVMFTFQHAARRAQELPGLSLGSLESGSGTARYDLTLEVVEQGDELECWFEHRTDLFYGHEIDRLAGHFRNLLEAAAARPAQSLHALPLLSPEERREVLAVWNDTRRDYPADRCLHELIEERCAADPQGVALVYEEAEVTYGELNRRANQLARHLRASGVGAGSLVGVCLERSAELVVSLLAILKAGGAYVPLDPDYPRERLAFMLEDSRAGVLVTQESLAGELPPHSARVVRVDADAQLFEGLSGESPGPAATPESLAYVIYTSGSTGKPKGVMVSHRNAVNFFAAMDERVGAEPAGTWLAVTSVSFDISVLELFWTLARGFKVVVQPEQERALALAACHGAASARPLDFSLFYFASSEEGDGADKYRLLLEGARFADRNGFSAVWTPERHFHEFGGLFPSPSLVGAALAVITERLQIRAGSVVLPLHHPVRVAEEWAVVDNLSRGRVGVSFASGWHSNDFVFAPDNYASRHALMYEQIEAVRSLWRGESVRLKGGAGEDVDVRVLPRPVQKELPVWVTAAGSVDTFRSAGRIGAGLLTHLLGQTVEELAGKIAAYREARREAGHDPDAGQVVLMLHTFVGRNLDAVREVVRAPFCRYLMQSVSLARNLARGLGFDVEVESLEPRELEEFLHRSFDRYFETSGLLGTPGSCMPMVNRLKEIGVNEVACLIDFGVEAGAVEAGLRHLRALKDLSGRALGAAPDYSLPAQIKRHGVTHLQCTPSMARMLLMSPGGPEALGSLRKLMVGGEALPDSLAARLREVVAGGEVCNMYGPTETTVWSTTHRLAPDDAGAPIGRPVANTQVYVLDPSQRPVVPGAAGELYIGGDGVAHGYLSRPALTAERFVPDAFGPRPGARLYRTGDLARHRLGGELEFLGRNDHQVKVRGFRIELGEIEKALGSHPAVSEAVVVARADDAGEQRLVAYLVPAAGASGALLPPLPRVGAEDVLDGRPQFRLPNGMVVAHHSSPQTGAIYREIFEERVYARHGIALRDGDTVFDVGANIGLFTLFVNQACRRPKVYAFEPIPPTFDRLRANVALYGLDVRLFEVGLADRDGAAPFTFYPEASGLSGRSDYAGGDVATTKQIVTSWLERHAGGGSSYDQSEFDETLREVMRSEVYDCRLTTLSRVIREEGVERIDLLKIDVEGGEVDAVNGIEEEDWAKIRQVVIEVDTREALEAIRARLEAHGFAAAVEQTTVVREGEDYVYTLYARRPAEQGAGEGGAAVEAEAAHAAPLAVGDLRGYLKGLLPDYMIPAAFVTLAALPLTPNGKVDRRQLPAPESAQPAARTAAYEAPRTEAERVVSEIWQEVLGVERIGVNDNFFDLGGNSLSLVKVHGRLQEVFGRELSIVDIFRKATVGALARHLSGDGAGPGALGQVRERASKQSEAVEAQAALNRERAQKFMRGRKR